MKKIISRAKAQYKLYFSKLKALFQSSKKNNQTVLKELFGITFFVVGVVILLSLLSFDSNDVSLLRDDKNKITNLLGLGGAHLADILLSIFGIYSFFFSLGFFFASYTLFFLGRFWFLPARRLGIVLILLGLMPLLSFNLGGKYNFYLSGSIGVALHALITKYFEKTGVLIFSFGFIWSGLVLAIARPFVKDFISFLAKPFINYSKKIKISSEKIEQVPEINELPKKVELKKEDAVTLKPEPNDIQIVQRKREILKPIEQKKTIVDENFLLPPLNLLDYDEPSVTPVDQSYLKKEAEKLQKAFLQFGIEGKIREIRPGPVVVNYEFVPAPGIKLSKIASLSDDIAMAMSAVQVRIVTPIPGKGAVGIEVPNEKRETVYLKEIVASKAYSDETHKLCMAIGKDVEGKPYFMNLADMPHVLIAGTTGSGKSVSVNAMICSILYRATPKDVRFLMIDPKMLELSIYNGIPHLLLPPIIDSKKAANALKWAVKEMDIRYELMKEAMVRDIDAYNKKVSLSLLDDCKPLNGRNHEHMPYIVIVVDEYADLLAVAGKDVETYIMRLAQKARACGIHVMLATQRPSVDVITGVIKANFPVRMGFRLASSHDSKTIINKNGAEKLLGRGDVLIMPPGTSDIYRVHGAFISEKELLRVIEFYKNQGHLDYKQEIAEFAESEDSYGGNNITSNEPKDEKFDEALGIVKEYQRCSTSFLQRQLGVGYNRAAKIVEDMEKLGFIGPSLNAKGEREIFIKD